MIIHMNSQQFNNENTYEKQSSQLNIVLGHLLGIQYEEHLTISKQQLRVVFIRRNSSHIEIFLTHKGRRVNIFHH